MSLPWAVAQLGWIAGPAVIFLFSFITYYTSTLLAACYRLGNPIIGEQNYPYMDVVRSILGGTKAKICGLLQYLNLFGVAIGWTVAFSVSMMAIDRSNCFHKKNNNSLYNKSSNSYIIAFGVIEIILSQIPIFDQLWWLHIVITIMSFTYATIGLALSIARVAENGKFKGSFTGISIDTVTQTQKVWRIFQALGNIAFAYSYSIEIQDMSKSPPSEAKTMKNATLVSVVVTTIFYMLYGCMGYAAFGDMAPGNLLAGFGFFNPCWLVDIANASIAIHLLRTYQVYTRPLFGFIEDYAERRFEHSPFVTKEIEISVLGFRPYKLKVFKLIWRTIFVILTTGISMLLPFFNDVVGLLGALGFWPLAVYFPVEMYIAQMKIPKWSTKWLCLQMLSVACLIITIATAAGSIAGVVLDLKSYKPFRTRY
ncbi:hypothetical protein BT93_L0355 [Corymbia citriodora subsp. variegata]|uniref:Amino acid transporter transmembrane domain-containing protein n=1 Tax=Corymbia citriodora subsp. variegata TaxID=360336 RepID=A0A8T0CQ30_CORYI|nr:hypothetical protein BT93_L0355 [Corymbia citriodora subsp. variegata]